MDWQFSIVCEITRGYVIYTMWFILGKLIYSCCRLTRIYDGCIYGVCIIHIYITISIGMYFFLWVQTFKGNRSRGISNHTPEPYPRIIRTPLNCLFLTHTPLSIPIFTATSNNKCAKPIATSVSAAAAASLISAGQSLVSVLPLLLLSSCSLSPFV